MKEQSEAEQAGRIDGMVGRLLVHAELHDEMTDCSDKEEQEQFAADLRMAITEIERLHAAVEKALIQISGGLCYFSAQSKHAQLLDAQKTLETALRPNAGVKP